MRVATGNHQNAAQNGGQAKQNHTPKEGHDNLLTNGR
jgi:hypothetical protein